MNLKRLIGTISKAVAISLCCNSLTWASGIKDTGSEESICIERKEHSHLLNLFEQRKAAYPGSITSADEAAFKATLGKPFTDIQYDHPLSDEDLKIYKAAMNAYSNDEIQARDVLDALSDMSNKSHPLYWAWYGVASTKKGQFGEAAYALREALRSKPIMENDGIYSVINELHRFATFQELVYKPKGAYFFDQRPGNIDLAAVAGGDDAYKLAKSVLSCFKGFDADVDVSKCDESANSNPSSLSDLVDSLDDNGDEDQYAGCEATIESLRIALDITPDFSALVGALE